MEKRFSYGGQAVIEGVLIRGRKSCTLVVRLPNGDLHKETLHLPGLSNERLRSVPLIRGVLTMAETLILGVRALTRSANLALEDGDNSEELSPWALRGMLAASLTFGIFLFFLVPLLATRAVEGFFPTTFLLNISEGLFRLAILLGYIWLIGQMADVRRVFSYHGAEHMAVHSFEHGDVLEPQSLRQHPTMHPRCGTGFLLVVVVLAMVVFTLLGNPPLWISILSRVVLVPVIASISYEFIRWAGAHSSEPLGKLLITPGLALQKLTTRQPDLDQLDVAIEAMKGALIEDGVIPFEPSSDNRGTNGDTS